MWQVQGETRDELQRSLSPSSSIYFVSVMQKADQQGASFIISKSAPLL